jgi:hypothetical protein
VCLADLALEIGLSASEVSADFLLGGVSHDEEPRSCSGSRVVGAISHDALVMPTAQGHG